VERFAGISGNRDGIAHLPDGEFLPPIDLNCVETYFKGIVEKKYNGRNVIYSRCAHLTQPQKIHIEQGRAQCQNRNLCQRGCPFGGYFSSNSSTLPWAERTGNLTLKTDAVVHSIIYDEKAAKASGVKVIDAKTKEVTEYFAKVIFLNAAALNSNLILLNSTSPRFPNGLGNDNGLLGKYVAFHNYRARIRAEYDGFSDKTTAGDRPTSAYIPRFRNVRKQETDFLRGYASGFWAGRSPQIKHDGFGDTLLKNLQSKELGPWVVGSHMMGETIPKESNFVSLDSNQKDEWGMPLLKISIDYDANDDKMVKDYIEQFTEMYTEAGFKNIQASDSKQAPGLDIHEMGGVRMGRDAKTSLLNGWNQLHACKNVYVTDGSCMTSTATQNPSLTYMALAARAADHAFSELKKGNL
jgi:choline dehydrogenase-like flavoprotein